MPYITSDSLQRTFRIMAGSSTGTAFVIDVEGRQYMLTAQHIFQSVGEPRSIFIAHDKVWHEVGVYEYWTPTSGADIAVLALERVLVTGNHLTLGTELHVSEDVFFLGYPHDMYTDAGQSNNGFPVPFVKRGLISGLQHNPAGGVLLFIDGHNNPGFSGGPVIIAGPNNEQSVIGVVSGYRFHPEPIMLNHSPTGLIYNANTGLLLAHSIHEAKSYIISAQNGAEIR